MIVKECKSRLSILVVILVLVEPQDKRFETVIHLEIQLLRLESEYLKQLDLMLRQTPQLIEDW